MAGLKAAIIGAGRMAGTIDDEVIHYPACIRPYSHAAGYAQVPEVEVVAFADPDRAKVESLCARYGVPGGYSDYREMVEKEKPDIVSITTPCSLHAEMTVYCAQQPWVKGIYCEKGMACRLADCDAMVRAVESHGIKFNMGSLRRWKPACNKARELMDRGEIGTVNSVVSYLMGALLHTASHYIDLLCYFAGDPQVEWVQGTVLNGDFDPSAPRSDTDLSGIGTIRFSNGILGTGLSSSLSGEFEIIGSEGTIRTTNNGLRWYLRKTEPIDGYAHHREFNIRQFPYYPEESPTVRLIRDIVQAIETDGETAQGPRVARMSAEIAFGIVQSHRQGGARVALPLEERDYFMMSH